MSTSSKNRVIVLTYLHGGVSVSELARRYGLSRQWVYTLLARYRQAGLPALEPRSKASKNHPRRIPDAMRVEVVKTFHLLQVSGLDAGAISIRYHIMTRQLLSPSPRSIWRILHQAGVITAQPKKKPKAYLQRFVAAQPNETWQSDFTHWRLADESEIEILNWLDDHSRYLLFCRVYAPVRGRDVVSSFKWCINEYGIPASTLTDNGSVYTSRFTGGRNQFEYLLNTLGVEQKNGHPGHPQTQGKIERFHQTLKRWLIQQPLAKSIEELQRQLDDFRHIYNNQRPHRSLGMQTRAFAYGATLKARSYEMQGDEHYRIRFDRIDKFGKLTLRRAGRLHHLGVGTAHKGIAIIAVIDDQLVMVIDEKTGEVISQHLIDEERNYWRNIGGEVAIQKIKIG